MHCGKRQIGSDAIWHHRSDKSRDEAGHQVLGIGPWEGVFLRANLGCAIAVSLMMCDFYSGNWVKPRCLLHVRNAQFQFHFFRNSTEPSSYILHPAVSPCTQPVTTQSAIFYNILCLYSHSTITVITPTGKAKVSTASYIL